MTIKRSISTPRTKKCGDMHHLAPTGKPMSPTYNLKEKYFVSSQHGTMQHRSNVIIWAKQW